MMNNPIETTQVLIVGAGPVGLALAVELGLMGVDCILIEQRDGAQRVPKMSQVSSRTMELCRRWSIAEIVRSAVWSSSHPLDFVYLTNLTGDEVGRLKVPSYGTLGKVDYSPEGTCTCPQIYFDPILAAKAQSLESVTVRYNAELLSFEQNEDSVRALVVDTNSGQEQTLSARYLVGSDGAGGVVRKALEIELDGAGTIAHSINIFFRSPDLASLHDKGWARFYRLIDEAGCWSELIAIDGQELWRLTVFDDPSPDADADAYLRKMLGQAFAYEIIDVSTWERRDYVANAYRKGRGLLVGDSAHQCSPTGGLGMHTGICEAVNLAWKLAALCAGWGGPRLLDSFEAECRPIAKCLVDKSTNTFNAIADLPGATGIREALADRAILSKLNVPEQVKAQFAYLDSPICVADQQPTDDPFSPMVRPGGRAPHCWLADGRSTIDLFGDQFVLLRLGGTVTEVDTLVAAARNRGVPLQIIDIDQPDIADRFGKDLALIRPDSHIAWLGDVPHNDAESLIDYVRGA